MSVLLTQMEVKQEGVHNVNRTAKKKKCLSTDPALAGDCRHNKQDVCRVVEGVSALIY